MISSPVKGAIYEATGIHHTHRHDGGDVAARRRQRNSLALPQTLLAAADEVIE
jgi:hypothetical protein